MRLIGIGRDGFWFFIGPTRVFGGIRAVQDLLGHRTVATTQIYTHVMAKPGIGVRSPLDG